MALRVAACAPPRSAVYRRRQPERTLLYRTVQTHLATWLTLQEDGAGASAPAATERGLGRHLDCGILAHGFARARCSECGHDFLIAYSCKCRGVCPSCTTRRMVETAAHLAGHVIARLPVRQWVLAVEAAPAEPLHRKAARYVWALLLARIYEVLPLLCPRCGGEMRIIAFITEAAVIQAIPGHLGEPKQPPRLRPARGPPLWEMPDRGSDAINPQAQPMPDYEFGKRVAW